MCGANVNLDLIALLPIAIRATSVAFQPQNSAEGDALALVHTTGFKLSLLRFVSSEII